MKKTLLLLANGFEVLEASAFIDVMGWNHLEGSGNTELHSCGLQKDVISSFNQRINVDYTLPDLKLENYDALAVPGGFEEFGFYEQAFQHEFLSVIRHFHDRQLPIASICTGALPLAKSGILKDQPATTYPNPKRRKILEEYGALPIDKRVVVADNIITSSGPATAVTVALLLLEKLTNSENAMKVRQLMGFA